MPTANCVARYLRVLIGADEQDWSEAVGDFAPGHEGMAEDGIIITEATLAIFDLGPESISPRANPARWREGNLVQIAIRNDAGDAWVPWGSLRILAVAGEPEDGVIDLELGCWLSWAGRFEAVTVELEGDESGITLGTPENCATVAARLLQASGIPAEAIDLSGWDYSIDYPLQKEGSGSYVAQAASLAFANLHRHLVQYPDGIIRAVQWDTTPGTPVGSFTVGAGEREFKATPDPIQPVEQVIVSGVGFPTSETPSRYSSRTSKEIPASVYKPDATGSVVLSTTIVNTRSDSSRTIRSETRTTYPKIARWIGSSSLGLATEIKYEEKRYSLTTGALVEVESGVLDSIRTLLPPGALTDRTTISKTTTEYTYNSKEVLVKTVETTVEPRVKVDGGADANRLALVESQIVEFEWREERPDYWVSRESTEIAAARYPEGVSGDDIKPTALIPTPPTISRNSQPPSTDRWEESTAKKEEHYTATALWEHPGGATGLTRTREITIEPGFSNAQCFDLATREVHLLEGRREAYTIQLPLTDDLLWVAPLSTLTVNDGNQVWTFKVDGCQWLYGVQESSLSLSGICVARVPVAEPVGTPLPEFESGLVPGQEAPPEPDPFEPPVNAFDDVYLSGSMGAIGGSVSVALVDGLALSGSLGRIGGAVSVEVTDVVALSGSTGAIGGAIVVAKPNQIALAGGTGAIGGAVVVTVEGDGWIMSGAWDDGANWDDAANWEDS